MTYYGTDGGYEIFESFRLDRSIDYIGKKYEEEIYE